MNARSPAAPSAPALQHLVAEAARLCHVREVVLTCGTQMVAHWASDQHGARYVVATQPFGAGVDAYELNLLDHQPRRLTAEESASFQALTAALQQQLEQAPAVTTPPDSALVKDHVNVALDYVTDSFLLVMADWTIQHVNTQFERVVNRPRSELVGRKLWAAVPELVGTKFEAECRQAIQGSVPRVFEEFSPALGGRWFQSRAFPCKEGLAVLTIDVSERKTDELTRVGMEQKLLQAQRMEALGTLAGGIAHDFNNILGAILGHAGLARDHAPPGSPLMENLEQIRIAGERARDLVHQILAYSRAGTREFVHQPLRPLLEESLRLLAATLPASVELGVQLTDEPLAATANPSEVQQVLMNLCTNAWQALPEAGGRILVALDKVELHEPQRADVGSLLPGLYARIVVEDNGSGMDAEARSHLFEPFFTTKPRGQGTGLGLHVLSGIVSAHGGAVVVHTEPGRGSRFEVYLPAALTHEVQRARAAPAAAQQGRGEHVAYVDDDEVVQLMVERVLARAGFKVASYSDPHALVAAVRRQPDCYDLLITDYSMPGMNGLQVAREVRQQCPDIPIIIATGFASDELQQAVRALGRAEILPKEHTFEQLGERALRALASTRPPADRSPGD